MNSLRSLIKRSFLYSILSYYRKVQNKRKLALAQKKILSAWNENGRPVPPPHVYKIRTIQEYALKHNSKVLIETGTYLGETLRACIHVFEKLISIELDQDLYKNACEQFSAEPKVTIYQGDSGKVLEEIIPRIDQPCVFWLDGHYSEGFTAKGDLNTPILNELTHIFNSDLKKTVVLIDDARCFNGRDDYPTIAELENLVHRQNKGLTFLVKDDIIRIC